MEMEQWLEEAMVITNKSLHLMPSSIFKRCLESCRRQGASLVAIANAGNEVGLVDKVKLMEFKERIPEPHLNPLSREEVLAVKQNFQGNIATCQFLVNYFIGATKQIPVTLDFQAPDEKTAKDLSRVLGGLTRQAINSNEENAKKEDQDGNGNNNPA